MSGYGLYGGDTYDPYAGPEPPGPTYEEQCAADGHPYYGEERNIRAELPDYPKDWHHALMTGGRCYCGAKRYPVGGPATLPTITAYGRCKGCGEFLEAEVVVAGEQAHVVPDHDQGCNCAEASYYGETPTCPIPVACGPIDVDWRARAEGKG